MVPLNEYEARQADEIAAWKSERPSLVMAAFRGLSRPLSRLAARVVPAGTIPALVAKAEAMSEKFGGPARDRPHGGRPRYSKSCATGHSRNATAWP